MSATFAIITALIVTAILVTLINVFCVVIVIRSKNIRKTSHMTIFSLLLGHTIQGLLVIPCYAAKRSGIYKNTAVCDIFRFFYLFTNYVCCLSILVISLDRFVGVQYPMRYQVWITFRRMKNVLICVWTYIILICLIPFAPSDSVGCKYNPQMEWVMVMLFGHTLLPFVIIIICYTVILKTVTAALIGRKDLVGGLREAMVLTDENAKKKRIVKGHMKKAKVTYYIVGAYVLCWGPSFVYNTLLTVCPGECFHEGYFDSHAQEVVGFITKLLTFIDGIIAPVLYCCLNANFNHMRKKMFNSLRRKFTRDGNDDHSLVGRKGTAAEITQTAFTSSTSKC